MQRKVIAVALIILFANGTIPLAAEQPRYQIFMDLGVKEIRMLPNPTRGILAGQNISGYFQYTTYDEDGTIIGEPFNATQSLVEIFPVNETIGSFAGFTYVEQTDVPLFRNITISAIFVIVRNETSEIYPGFNITIPADVHKEGMCIGTEIEVYYSCDRTYLSEHWDITFGVSGAIHDLLGSSRAEFPWWLYAVIGIALLIFAIVIFELFYKRPHYEVYGYYVYRLKPKR